MDTLTLNPEIVYQVTGNKDLYGQLQFLAPIKDLALGIHEKATSAHCSNCTKKALQRAKESLAAAFVKLLLDESTKTPNKLDELKQLMLRITGSNAAQISVYYVKQGTGKSELKF